MPIRRGVSHRLIALAGGAVLAVGLAVSLTPTAASAGTNGDETGATIPADVIRASAAPGSTWRAEKATYGVGKSVDEPVTMADGTVLRADVYYPTTSSGARAKGPFPVVMTMTPYGKAVLGAGASSGLGSQTGPNTYLVQRGYIDVVADVRGTGDSQGEFGLFDPAQDRDGVTLVKWASRLPGSTGKVGLYGASYLGIDQLLTAGAEPAGSPLKAIFPVVPGNDLYQDTATMGGLIDIEFDAFYLALTGGLNTAGPLVEGLQDPSQLLSLLYPAEVQHLSDLASFDARFTAQTLLGKGSAYDGAYWKARNPVNVLKKIVANGIPAYLVGGEYDLFQRGEPLDFTGLQNAWSGRSVTAPMLANQKVTGRYQLLDGPFTHLGGSTAKVEPLQLEWFDTWLKGEKTGMDRTPTPLHYYDLGTGEYSEHAQYPFAKATPKRFYFSATKSGTAPLSVDDHTLTTARPTHTSADTLVWSPVGNPCGRPSDQWSAGAVSLATDLVAPNAPCVHNDVAGELGPDRATYTTSPFTSARTLAGPVDVTVYATATTKDTEWVAQVQDVAPDGTSTPLTEGALLGSMRAQSSSLEWRASDGQVIKPGHTFAVSAARPVTPGKVTRYDIEVFPTYATIAKGHRLRITLSTADSPHLVPTEPALANLIGGVYQVQISPTAPSAVELELLPT